MKSRRPSLLCAAAATVLIAVISATPAMASYTECTVNKDTDLAIMPNGPTEPRYQPVNKGDKVAFRGSYKDWWFVLHYTGSGADSISDYGWVPKSVLTDCREQDGTP